MLSRWNNLGLNIIYICIYFIHIYIRYIIISGVRLFEIRVSSRVSGIRKSCLIWYPLKNHFLSFHLYPTRFCRIYGIQPSPAHMRKNLIVLGMWLKNVGTILIHLFFSLLFSLSVFVFCRNVLLVGDISSDSRFFLMYVYV